jgi:ABC-type nitrate/sulfonate/bicarbonate transport system permease component
VIDATPSDRDDRLAPAPGPSAARRVGSVANALVLRLAVPAGFAVVWQAATSAASPAPAVPGPARPGRRHEGRDDHVRDRLADLDQHRRRVQSVDSLYLDTGGVYGAGRADRLVRIMLPSAAPKNFAGCGSACRSR